MQDTIHKVIDSDHHENKKLVVCQNHNRAKQSCGKLPWTIIWGNSGFLAKYYENVMNVFMGSSDIKAQQRSRVPMHGFWSGPNFFFVSPQSHLKKKLT